MMMAPCLDFLSYLKSLKKFNLKIVSIEDLIGYRMKLDSLIEKIFDENIKTSFGEYRFKGF